MDRLISRKEAAAILDISEKQIQRGADGTDRLLEVRRPESRRVSYRLSDVQALMAEWVADSLAARESTSLRLVKAGRG